MMELQKTEDIPVMRVPSRRKLSEAKKPTLIAKSGPRAGYSKVLVAIDAASDPAALMDGACQLAADPNLVLLSVLSCSLDDRLRYIDASEEKLRKVRARRYEDALDGLDALSKATALQANRVTTMVEHGEIAFVVLKLQQELDIDLTVIGTQRTTALSRFFLRNAAWEIIENAKCHVLAVPGKAGYLSNPTRL